MKLYYSQYTRSGRARWIPEEIGVAYEIAHLSFQRNERETPEHLAIRPHGSVPADLATHQRRPAFRRAHAD